MIIAISGPTGAGKTSIARLLVKYPGTRIVGEPLPLKLLADFSREPEKYCFELQREIISGRLFNSQQQRPFEHSDLVVLERTAAEDREVFLRFHFELGYLKRHEFDWLSDLTRDVEQEIGEPVAIIFVNAKQEILLQRMVDMNVPAPLVAALPRQLELYQEWATRCSVPVAFIDTSTLALSQLPDLVDWIVMTVRQLGKISNSVHMPTGTTWTWM